MGADAPDTTTSSTITLNNNSGIDLEIHETLTGHFEDSILITELSQKYPDVPIFPDVNVRELTGGESNPVFLTLPIGQANVVSGNKRFYGEDFLTVMEQQVRANKPVGLMGHLAKEDRATAFPLEAVHWVGCQRFGELLLGKGYLPEGEARTRLQRYRATNKKIATSIDATGDFVWDEQLKASKLIAETFQLGQIDIAPADRAGVRSLAAVPVLTQEMADTNFGSYVVKEERDMGKDEVIRELTAEDASALPQSVKDELQKRYLAEMRKSLGLGESDDVVAIVKTLQSGAAINEQTAINNRITELVSDEKTGIKSKSVRAMVTELVKKSNPKDIAEAEKIYEITVESDMVKEALQEFMQDTMGPPQRTATQPRTESSKGKFFIIPEIPEED